MSASHGSAAVDGPTLFARYAYPPNALGYCGPGDGATLLRHGAGEQIRSAAHLTALAQAFDGAWAYLEFIAERTGLDPMDRAVVEAYWLGTNLLDGIDLASYGPKLLEALRRRASPASSLPEQVPAEARCDHNFHCFAVYPWTGLLAAGRGGDRPRAILDQCRIRWGEVVAVTGDRAEVRVQPLTWDGRQLGLGAPQPVTATWTREGLGFIEAPQPGDMAALHWDWICDLLDERAVDDLRRSTLRQLAVTNRQMP